MGAAAVEPRKATERTDLDGVYQHVRLGMGRHGADRLAAPLEG
jgi:hypothetical protein